MSLWDSSKQSQEETCELPLQLFFGEVLDNDGDVFELIFERPRKTFQGFINKLRKLDAVHSSDFPGILSCRIVSRNLSSVGLNSAFPVEISKRLFQTPNRPHDSIDLGFHLRQTAEESIETLVLS
jgi:hypothetical protein